MNLLSPSLGSTLAVKMEAEILYGTLFTCKAVLWYNLKEISKLKDISGKGPTWLPGACSHISDFLPLAGKRIY
jgi:hypothetical protein